MTLGEIKAGIEPTRDHDSAKVAEIERWLELMATAYNVLPMDAQSYRVWAQPMHARSDTFYEDAMIAATAHSHNLTAVTRNLADFAGFDVPVMNPFKPGGA